jgi:FixJ family two-component response regulator
LLTELAQDLARAILAARARLRRKKETAQLAADYQSLTPREREVMNFVARGLPNKEIASRLGTAEITVKIQRGNVMKKMKAGSIADLVRMADKLAESQTKV